MNMFSNKQDGVAQEILDEIRTLSKRLANLEGQRDAAREELQLSGEIIELRHELTRLKIEKDREDEKHEREKREVKHMVGLERKRSEQESTMAKREATLSVREENLKAQVERFEDTMKFRQERFDKEVGYLQDLMKEVLKRLPTVSVEKSIEIGGNGNGKHTEEVEA